MTDVDVRDFVEAAHLGEDIEFSLNNKKFFAEGWFSKGVYTLCIFEISAGPGGYLWYKEGPDRDDLAEELLSAPIFDGKTFWEVKDKLEWVY